MKTKTSSVDQTIYILLCILSGGLFWILRILISEAIRKALQNEEK